MAAIVFSYRAIDHAGDIQSGTLNGRSTGEVADRVRRMGLRPIEVRKKSAQVFQKDFSMPGFGGKKKDELALFSRQFSTMTSAGTPILRCLSTLERQIDNQRFAEAVALVRADVENGDQLSVAMERQSGWVSEFYVSMVRAGEASGSLPDVLERLAVAAEQQAALRKKVKSAMAYPTAVAGLIALCVVAMLMFLIPTFSGIFDDLGGKLPLPTRVVIGASDLLTGYFPIVALGVGAAVWCFKRWKRSESGRRRWDRFKLRLPVFGKLARQTALARFGRSLAVLTSTGVPVVTALDIARVTAQNMVVFDAVGVIAEKVNNGSRVADAMEEHAIFDPMVVQMVSVGEESGALDLMLTKVADMFEQNVNTTVDSLTSLLEPLLIVAMGVTVGGMLVAVYLPMFKAVELVK